MKATLEFDLPEEHDEAEAALNAMRVLADVHEFGEYLRSQEKYVEPENRDDIHKIRAAWFGIMGDWLE